MVGFEPSGMGAIPIMTSDMSCSFSGLEFLAYIQRTMFRLHHKTQIFSSSLIGKTLGFELKNGCSNHSSKTINVILPEWSNGNVCKTFFHQFESDR